MKFAFIVNIIKTQINIWKAIFNSIHTESIKEHKKSKRLATVTATKPPGRFGALSLKNGNINSFKEKPSEQWINAGFFVLSNDAIKHIDGDNCAWEEKPMEKLAKKNQFV